MSKPDAPERELYYFSHDGGDPWGSDISHLFAIAEAVYAVDGEVWEGFRPGLSSGDPETDDWPDAEYVALLRDGLDREALHHWYRVLLRHSALLDQAGFSY